MGGGEEARWGLGVKIWDGDQEGIRDKHPHPDPDREGDGQAAFMHGPPFPKESRWITSIHHSTAPAIRENSNVQGLSLLPAGCRLQAYADLPTGYT